MDSGQTDKELVQSFREGNQAAFNLLAARYMDKIYWHARRMTGNHPDADDIVQEVLMVMYHKLVDFRFQSSVYTWVYKITATRSLNYLKKRKVRELFSLDDDENPVQVTDPVNVEENAVLKEKMEHLESALQKLPLKQREAFVMRNYEQLSYEEISAITGKSTGALKANYFHAVEKLQKLLKGKQ